LARGDLSLGRMEACGWEATLERDPVRRCPRLNLLSFPVVQRR